MDDWSRAARRGAAYRWGARHYRWYAARQYAGPLAAGVAVLVGLGAATAAACWLLQRIPAPVVLLGVALAALGSAAVRVAHLMMRARGGGSLGLLALVAVAVACVVGAVLLS